MLFNNFLYMNNLSLSLLLIISIDFFIKIYKYICNILIFGINNIKHKICNGYLIKHMKHSLFNEYFIKYAIYNRKSKDFTLVYDYDKFYIIIWLYIKKLLNIRIRFNKLISINLQENKENSDYIIIGSYFLNKKQECTMFYKNKNIISIKDRNKNKNKFIYCVLDEKYNLTVEFEKFSDFILLNKDLTCYDIVKMIQLFYYNLCTINNSILKIMIDDYIEKSYKEKDILLIYNE